MRTHSTIDAAKVLTRACGRTVGEHFVHRVFHDLYGEKHAPGSGRPIRLTDRQVDVFRMYAVVNYNRRPPVPVREWLRDNGIPVPRMAPEMRPAQTREVSREVKRTQKSTSTTATEFTPAQMRQIDRLIEKRISQLVVAGSEKSPPKQLTDGTATSPSRRYITNTVSRFVNERTESTKSDYRRVWSDTYRVFFSSIGDTDVERWKVGRDYTSTLDYIEQQGVLQDFADLLPRILDGLKAIYPIQGHGMQQGLFDAH